MQGKKRNKNLKVQAQISSLSYLQCPALYGYPHLAFCGISGVPLFDYAFCVKLLHF